MTLHYKFPVASWLWRCLTSRRAKIIVLSLIGALFLLSISARLSIYLAARRMQAVVAGLGKLEIDKTAEEELRRTVPYLVRSPWEGHVKSTPETGKLEEGTSVVYSVGFTNQETWMKYGRLIRTLGLCSEPRFTKEGYEEGCAFLVPDLLGYRYYSFGAAVWLLNGKVSGIRYAINDRLVFPQAVGAIVSVRSFHSIWHARQIGFEVDSVEDENPQFRINASEHHLVVAYAYDAPPQMTKDAFEIDLSCFWSLRGCKSAREIAPQLWQDNAATEAAAIVRLESKEPCPARIVVGRVRYLPDAGITLAESKGIRQVPMNIEGDVWPEAVKDFKLIEVLRPPRVMSLEGVRRRPFAPFPGDQRMQILRNRDLWPEKGQQVLFFANMRFDTCQILLATPDVVSAAGATLLAPKREEDQTGLSLQ